MNLLNFIFDEVFMISVASYSLLKYIVAIKVKIRFCLCCNRIIRISSPSLSHVGYRTMCLCTSSPKLNPLSLRIKYV